jgi:hypothetical protein
VDVSGAGGLVFEVDLEVETAIAADYRAWLRGHVAGILALPGFLGATVSEVLEPAPPAGFAGLCVQYRLENEAAYAIYLRDHAPGMRAEGEARFGGRFRARRRVLRPFEER